MKLYHVTTVDRARVICAQGFDDERNGWHEYSAEGFQYSAEGIQFANEPGEGVGATLAIDGPEEELQPYRVEVAPGRTLASGERIPTGEYIIPAKMANRYFTDRQIRSIADVVDDTLGEDEDA